MDNPLPMGDEDVAKQLLSLQRDCWYAYRILMAHGNQEAREAASFLRDGVVAYSEYLAWRDKEKAKHES